MSFLTKFRKTDDLFDEFTDNEEQPRLHHRVRETVKWLWIGVRWWGITLFNTIRNPRKHWISALVHGFVAVSLALSLRFGFVPTQVREVTKYPAAHPGTTLSLALADSIDGELDHGAILWGWVLSGWGPNDPWPWPRMLYPYRNQYQMGKRFVWELVVRRLQTGLSQKVRDVTEDENIDEALDRIHSPQIVFATPSNAWHLEVASDKLRAYAKALPDNDNFHARIDTLIPLVDDLKYALNRSVTSLRPQQIGFMMGWVPFEYAQGVVSAVIEVLETINTDFASVLSLKAQSDELLNDAIADLKNALGMSPWVVCNGEFFCIGNNSNDVSNLNQRLSAGERSLDAFAQALRYNK